MQQSLLLAAAFAAMFALVPTASALCLTPNCAPRRPASNCARAPAHSLAQVHLRVLLHGADLLHPVVWPLRLDAV